MEKKNVKNLFPLNIQFFADGDESSGEDNPGGENNEENSGEENPGGENKPNKQEKMFTQKQVTAMMAKEKREGKRSVLSSLGFENEEDAKRAVKLLKALTDSQKSEVDIKNESNKKLEGEKQDAEKKALIAEAKLECLILGVDKECIDDVLLIAMPKVEEGNTLEDVLKEMKKNKRYSSFFGVKNNEGTGNPPGHNSKSNNEVKGIGKRLAESTKSQVKKSSYFD